MEDRRQNSGKIKELPAVKIWQVWLGQIILLNSLNT